MKIGLAQTTSLKGNVPKNIQDHLRIIKRAIKLQADLIVFPELSITSYEPELAKDLVTDVNSSLFNPFQVLSDAHEITIGIGMPTPAFDGIHIGHQKILNNIVKESIENKTKIIEYVI